MKIRVIIVEDEPLVALELETTLKDAGFEIVGVAASNRRALDLIDARNYDVAVLDANLRDEEIELVASAAQRAAKPFLLVSGYDPAFLPAVFLDAPLVTKPFDPNGLVKAILNLLDFRSPVPG